jgi:hypothetical protein
LHLTATADPIIADDHPVRDGGPPESPQKLIGYPYREKRNITNQKLFIFQNREFNNQK